MKDSFQTIIGLFIVLAIILSMGLQFSNKDGFQNTSNVGSKLDYKPVTKIKNGTRDGYTRELGLGYLGTVTDPNSIVATNKFDGMPSHY
jgi:hypothetical protein